MSKNAPSESFKKPLLRGYFHQEAFFVALGACILLIAQSSNPISLISSVVYSFGLLMLLGSSAVYHRPQWAPLARARLKRLDHSAIFFLIAGTFTPVCLLALPADKGQKLLLVVWSFALVGVIQSLFWSNAPKFVTAPFYVILGWLALPYLSELRDSMGLESLILLGLGGVIYTIGAVFYVLKFPKKRATIFGYHELFHVLTVIAATLHFIVVYRLVR